MPILHRLSRPLRSLAAGRLLRHPRIEIPVGLVFVAAVVTLVLGTIGYDQNFKAQGLSRSFSDEVYAALQLFVLNFAGEPPIQWELQVARGLAAFASFGAVVLTFFALFRQQLAELRVRFVARRHVIVCGLGPCGASLARGFQGTEAGGTLRKRKVVAIEATEDGPGAVSECRDAGITVLIGDARKESMLNKAGLGRARYVVAACGNDGISAEVAAEIRRLLRTPDQLEYRRKKGLPLDCFVHLDDAELSTRFAEIQAADPDHPVWLHFFNPSESAAAAMLLGDPALEPESGSATDSPHLLVVGAHQMGSRLILHAARCRRFTSRARGPKLRVTMVDKEAESRREYLRQEHPWLDDHCEFTPLPPLDVDTDAEFVSGEFLRGLPAPTSVYVCLDRDDRGLRAALTLDRHPETAGARIVVRTGERTGLATILESGGTSDGPVAFGLVCRTCTPRMLLSPQNELLAQTTHEDYVTRELAAGKRLGSNAPLRRWTDLSDYYRESNRADAEHMGAMLKKFEYYIDRLSDRDAELITLAEPEVEEMARTLHERWRSVREADGWTLAEERNDERREHPDLMAWDRLARERPESAANVRRVATGIPISLVRAELFAVKGDATEVIAKAIHERYLEAEVRTGRELGSDPALRAWSELSEHHRDSNRGQARGYDEMLGAVGCEIVAFVARVPGLVAFSMREVETMARMEHERWCAEKERAGWRHAQERNEDRKEHPDLAPWRDLTDEAKEKDRRTVRGIPQFLDRVGFAVAEKQARPPS